MFELNVPDLYLNSSIRKKNCLLSTLLLLADFDKRYFVYIGPSTEEENLPENAKYNASEEKFFSFNQSDATDFRLDAGKICERGSIC